MVGITDVPLPTAVSVWYPLVLYNNFFQALCALHMRAHAHTHTHTHTF
jgi:hypothetical protein